jgi:predicted dehydrogenase
MQSRPANGGTLAIEVAGGRPPATPFRMEVIGETGTLRLEGGAPRGFQSSRLTLSLNDARRRLDEGELAAMPDAAANVAGMYAALRDAIVGNTPLVANFDHAVQLTQLITDLFNSPVNGRRVLATNWPER